MKASQLAAEAERRGVQTSYVDAAGEPVECDADGVAAVLAALGDDPPAPPEAVLVAWDGALDALPPGCTVVDDAGRALAPRALPFGYHRLERGGDVVGTVISAPVQAPASRGGRWGVMLPLYALHSAATDGLATYPELDGLFDWLHDHGGDLLLTLPLLPLYLDPPADWSPYSPVSRRFWNELYVDLDAEGAPPAPPAPPLVDGLLDYPALAAHRTARLDHVAAAREHDPAFAAWRCANPLAETYARFRGAQAALGRNHREWAVSRDDALAAADPVVVRRHLVGQWLADSQLGATADRARTRGQILALDVALGAHADGFDVWHEGDLFVQGVAVGAPPDPIFMGGQDWGFPPIHPERSRRTGHRYVRETFRHHLRHAGLLRIDHVMGLARQWWIAAGHPATSGCYVRYPLEELMAIACLEAHLAGAVVVGENLGTVPPEVNRHLHEHRMLGIEVSQDWLHTWGTDDVHVASPTRMAMLSTHDSLPFAGVWYGDDILLGNRLGLIPNDEVEEQMTERAEVRRRTVAHLVWTGRLERHDAPLDDILAGVVDEVASQPSPITVFNVEDFWLERRPQNVPGTFQEEPNWRRIAARSLESFRGDERIGAIADRIDARRRASAAQAVGA